MISESPKIKIEARFCYMCLLIHNKNTMAVFEILMLSVYALVAVGIGSALYFVHDNPAKCEEEE